MNQASLPLLIANIHLGLSASAWWYILLALLAVGGSFLIYRFTLPPVSPLRKALLWVLRSAALVLLLLLLFEPVLSYLRHQAKPPVVALLVDRSASMSISAGQEDRGETLKRLLASPALRDLAHKSQLKVFEFADTTTEVPLDSLRTLTPSGVGTDVAGSWVQAQKALAGENLAAGVLISDGAYNLGQNPARVAGESAIPLYTIGIGDTSSSTDAAVAEVVTNDVTYVGSKVPVDVRIRAHGLDGRSSVVHLLSGKGGEFDRQPVRFASDDAEDPLTLNLVAREPGDLRITVALDSVPGERSITNNRRSVVIRVLERKSRVLLFAGAPSADLSILRQTLEADTTLEVSALVEIGAGRFLHGAVEPSQDDMSRASLIVLCEFPSRGTSDALLQKISHAVQDKHVPLLLLAGPHLSASRLAALNDVVPIQANKPALTEEQVTLRPAASHPALEGKNPLPAQWSELPPVLGGAGNFSVAPSAQVVAKISRENLGISEDEPGIAVWQTGFRRGAAFLCWGTSRWKMQLAGTQNASAFYDELVTRVRGWLIAPAEEQRVKIRTTKKVYSGGEPVRFVAQVYGADLAPRDDASIALRATSGSRTEVVPMRGLGNGRYEGQLTPWIDGDYRFTGSAVAGKDTLGSDNGLFAVEAFNIELMDPRARFDVLQQVAAASKAAFVPASRADSLLSRLQFAPQTITSRKEWSLWSQGPVIWIIIGLLVIEWIVRKRSGML
ncbi:MAG TPA: vWA domain-containing protein [bacterium]|jgi:hypothetical protein